MGYTTNFVGEFSVEPALKDEHREYLEMFAETRRMQRDPAIASTLPDPLREAVGLPIGEDGGYFVGPVPESIGEGVFGARGQAKDDSVTDYNTPPTGQPGLWCQWVPSEDGSLIVWDEGEKFYYYVDWLRYLIEHFLKPWGYRVDGEVEWCGEDSWDDRGKIVVDDNQVTRLAARIVYE